MTPVTLRKDEVTRVLVHASADMPDLYGPLMVGWIGRAGKNHATYDLSESERAFVARCLPHRSDLRSREAHGSAK